MSQFKIPKPDLQITFYHRLREIRKTYLLDALLSVVAKLEIPMIDKKLSKFVSNSALQKIAGWGLRGEIVFAVPNFSKYFSHNNAVLTFPYFMPLLSAHNKL